MENSSEQQTHRNQGSQSPSHYSSSNGSSDDEDDYGSSSEGSSSGSEDSRSRDEGSGSGSDEDDYGEEESESEYDSEDYDSEDGEEEIEENHLAVPSHGQDQRSGKKSQFTRKVKVFGSGDNPYQDAISKPQFYNLSAPEMKKLASVQSQQVEMAQLQAPNAGDGTALAGAIEFLRNNSISKSNRNRTPLKSNDSNTSPSAVRGSPQELLKGRDSSRKMLKGRDKESPSKGKKSEHIRYKFQKLNQEKTEESQKGKVIQVNKFKYLLDMTNEEVMSFLGLAASGSTDMNILENKKQFQQLMKQDKMWCSFVEMKEFLFEALKIGRGSKKGAKKYLESQKIRDPYNQKIRVFGSNSNLTATLEFFSAFGIQAQRDQLASFTKVFAAMALITIPTYFYLLGGDANLMDLPQHPTQALTTSIFARLSIGSLQMRGFIQLLPADDLSLLSMDRLKEAAKFEEWHWIVNDCVASLIFICGCLIALMASRDYFQEMSKKRETIERYTCHVLIPQDQPRSQALSSLTMRQIHKHYSDAYGPISRIYFGRDFYDLHQDLQNYCQGIREEHELQLKTEHDYFQLRERVIKDPASLKAEELFKKNQTFEAAEKYNKDLLELRKENTTIEAALLEKYIDHPFDKNQVNSCFIIFENLSDATQCLKDADELRRLKSWWKARSSWEPKDTELKGRAFIDGKIPVEVRPAVKPEFVLWPNLDFVHKKLNCGQIMNRYGVILAVVIVGFVLAFELSLALLATDSPLALDLGSCPEEGDFKEMLRSTTELEKETQMCVCPKAFFVREVLFGFASTACAHYANRVLWQIGASLIFSLLVHLLLQAFARYLRPCYSELEGGLSATSYFNRSNFQFFNFVSVIDYRKFIHSQFFWATLFVQVLSLPLMYLACAYSLKKDEIKDFTLHRFILSFALPLHVHVLATAFLNFLSAAKIPSCRSKQGSSSANQASLTQIKIEGDKSNKLEGFKLSPYKYNLQLNIDNANQAPTYKLEIRSTQNYALIFGLCFVFSAVYPLLMVIGFLYLLLTTQTEGFMIGRTCKIRKNKDISSSELLSLQIKSIHLFFIMKMALALFVFGDCYREAIPEGPLRDFSRHTLVNDATILHEALMVLYFLGLLLASIGTFSKIREVYFKFAVKQKLKGSIKSQQRASFSQKVEDEQTPVVAQFDMSHGKPRSFSEVKKDLRNKMLVTYDIFENKEYRNKLRLAKHLMCNDKLFKMLRQQVLPIETFPDKVDSMLMKMKDNQLKKKKAAAKKEKASSKFTDFRADLMKNNLDAELLGDQSAPQGSQHMLLEDIVEEPAVTKAEGEAHHKATTDPKEEDPYATFKPDPFKPLQFKDSTKPTEPVSRVESTEQPDLQMKQKIVFIRSDESSNDFCEDSKADRFVLSPDNHAVLKKMAPNTPLDIVPATKGSQFLFAPGQSDNTTPLPPEGSFQMVATKPAPSQFQTLPAGPPKGRLPPLPPITAKVRNNLLPSLGGGMKTIPMKNQEQVSFGILPESETTEGPNQMASIGQTLAPVEREDDDDTGVKRQQTDKETLELREFLKNY